MVDLHPDGPCRIVIADCDPDVCHLLARTVRCLSHEVTVVGAADQLIARLQTARADILLLEPMLLGWRAGLELCTSLTNTSIIVITTRTSPEDRDAARLSGAVDVITKPFSPRNVRERVAASCPQHPFSD